MRVTKLADRITRRSRMKKLKSVIFLTLLGILIVLLQVTLVLPCPAQTPLPTVKLEVQPAALELLPSQTSAPVPGSQTAPVNEAFAKARVIVRNPGPGAVTDLRLSWLDVSGLKVVPADTTLTEAQTPNSLRDRNPLLPQNDRVYILLFQQAGNEPVSSTLQLSMSCVYAGQAKNTKATTRVVLASLPVKSREPETIEQVVDVQVKTALESLMQYQRGKIFLVVTNKSNVAMQASYIGMKGPSFIQVDEAVPTPEGAHATSSPPKSGDASALASLIPNKPAAQDSAQNKPLRFHTILPHQNAVIDLNAKIVDKLQSGKHQLLFHIKATQQKTGEPAPVDIFVPHQVTVGVPGETAVLTLLGVPSLLILPGFLVFVMAGLLWRLGLFKSIYVADSFPLPPNTAEFWLAAISVSIVILFGYRLSGNNILTSYDLQDLLFLWFLSLALGAVFYLVGMVVYTLYQSGRIPSGGDDALTVLHKLGRQKLGVYLDRVSWKTSDSGKEQTRTVFLLQRHKDGKESYWVGPGIQILWGPKAPPELKNEVRKQLNKDGNLSLLALLLTGKDSNIVKVHWDPDHPMKNVVQAKASDFTGDPTEVLIISQETSEE